MTDNHDTTESKVEKAKKTSHHLRGTLADTLVSGATHFGEDDTQLLKFHGAYQQDDREQRRERRAQGFDKAYQFMIRCAIPGGAVTADQYLALDALADERANGSMRITTRQGIQFHGVLMGNLKGAIAGIHTSLLTTLAACGDVRRNVMACPAPLADESHRLLEQTARQVAADLAPHSRAYHEIWLDEEKVVSTRPEEPFYGDRYLPRKFKVGIALPHDNCVDVYTQDCGLIAIVSGGAVRGFNLLVGGGMGMTHAKPDTFAKLAEPLGFVALDHAVEAVRTVAAIFRDHGNRADRRHARLKYLMADWGMARFREEFSRRVGFELHDSVALPPPACDDHLGRHEQGDGKWFYGVFVENGRIADQHGHQIRTALRRIVERHRPGVRLTPHQNILLTHLDRSCLGEIEQTLRDHHVATVEDISAARRWSMACPALPTCGLALAESERLLPSVISTLEDELEKLGLRSEPLTIRMTGCPNGCARPYTADIAFVGRRPDVYHVFVGGGLPGDRVADLYAADVPTGDITRVLRPLLTRWADSRRDGEGLSDFYQRIAGHEGRRIRITGKEEPTSGLIRLDIAT